MGEVYLADDTHLRRQVALKFLSKDFGDNEEFRRRFIREARTAAALNHPSIVTMYDVSEHQGRPFIAMEFIEGRPLKEMARAKELDFAAVHRITSQLASGLEAAHQAGIIHRDIKSDNVIIDSRGNAHILDFGLARGGREQNLTQTGTTLGTISYMSPEQAEGKTVDGRSDLFSLGVVLYEAITGRLPFKGDHLGAVINAILNLAPESLDEGTRKNFPPKFIEIMFRLLEKEPAKRLQSASDLLDELYQFGELTAIVRTQRKVNRKVIGTVLGLILIVAMLATYIVWNPDREQKKATDSIKIAVLPFENLGTDEDSYFAVGIGDEINTQLSKLKGLGVISRASVSKYGTGERDLSAIEKELGVEWVVQGRILWDKSVKPVRVRISAALSSTKKGTELWADSYDEVLDDIFSVQADIARKISRSLNIQLGSQEEKSLNDAPTTNMEAFTFYLQGNDYFNQEQWEIAVEMYGRAIALDSNFALAYANLSRSHSLMYWHYLDRSSERLALAKEAAERALFLRPEVPETHLAMGRYFYRASLDYGMALEEYQKALKLQPGNSDLLFAVGSVKRRQGMWADALDYFERAVDLDPRSMSKLTNLGDTYALSRNFQDSRRVYNRSKSLAPDNATPYSKLFTLQLRENGDVRSAKAELDSAPPHVRGLLEDDYITAISVLNGPEAAIARLGTQRPSESFTRDSSYYYLRMGELQLSAKKKLAAAKYFDSARFVLEQMTQKRPNEPQYLSLLAVACAGSGDVECAANAGQRSIELCPITTDALSGSNWLYNRMISLVILQDYISAKEDLKMLLEQPSVVTVPFLKVNPIFEIFLRESSVVAVIDEFSTR